MSEQKWTKEPWCLWRGLLYEGGGEDICIGAGETWLANMDRRIPRCPQILDSGHRGPACDICTIDADGITEEQLANAERIVACVNAMAGIDDPAAFMAEVREVLGEAKGIRELCRDHDSARHDPRYNALKVAIEIDADLNAIEDRINAFLAQLPGDC